MDVRQFFDDADNFVRKNDAIRFKKFKRTKEGQELIELYRNELMPVEEHPELKRLESRERRNGRSAYDFGFIASYCPECNKLNWHNVRLIKTVDSSCYTKTYAHKTCCKACGRCYLIGDNIKPHLITLPQSIKLLTCVGVTVVLLIIILACV